MMSSGGKPTSSTRMRIGALADADLFLVGRGLPLLVKGHDHHRRAILEHRRSILAKLHFAFLERDRVDDALALQALEPGLDDLPFGGVHHEGDLGNLGLAGQQLQIARHGGDAVDHALVHADVEDVGAVLHLLPRYADRFFVFAFLHQLGKAGRTGHVGPLADHDVDAGLLGEGLRSRETQRLGGYFVSRASAKFTRSSTLTRVSRWAQRALPRGAGPRLRALWRWPRCAPVCCRSSRRQY